MGYYYGFRPYVSVAQRRRNAQREIEKKRKTGLKVLPIQIDGRTIARTFWGKAWCDNLESYSDYENRLPRGRTYVRNGSVVHLEIQHGRISALVSGSELYTVEITISSLPEPHWKRIKGQCAGQIGSLVELLQARLSSSVMEVVTARGQGLFPKPAEIAMKCSCPDWAGMCKHVAAVMYGIGARLDDQPELLFLLRKVDHLELISGAIDSAPVAKAGKARGKKMIAAGDVADVFGIELAEVEASTEVSAPAAKTAVKAGASSPKTGSSRKSARAVTAGSKKSMAAKAVGSKQTRTAKARSESALAAQTKPHSRKRAKQKH